MTMVRILLVEDDPNKAAQVEGLLEVIVPNSTIERAESYRSGLKRALTEDFDLLCVDMTLPTYDPGPDELGGRIRAYGGKHLIAELKRKRRRARVVVVTQFETFGDGDDSKSLTQLKAELLEEFPEHYLGTVFYQAATAGWREELKRLVTQSMDGGE